MTRPKRAMVAAIATHMAAAAGQGVGGRVLHQRRRRRACDMSAAFVCACCSLHGCSCACASSTQARTAGACAQPVSPASSPRMSAVAAPRACALKKSGVQAKLSASCSAYTASGSACASTPAVQGDGASGACVCACMRRQRSRRCKHAPTRWRCGWGPQANACRVSLTSLPPDQVTRDAHHGVECRPDRAKQPVLA